MTDETTKLLRRTVLRRSAFATAAATIGVGGFAGTALASDCPRTPGFWANHDWCEVDIAPDSEEFTSVAEVLGIYDGAGECPDSEYCLRDNSGDVIKCKLMADWQEFLVQNTRGDKAIKMAQTLLATILNFQLRPSDDGDCVDLEQDFSEFGQEETTTVRDVKQRAEEWLSASSFCESKQKHWTVNVDGEDVDGEPLKNVLDAFNNGNVDGDCDCPEEDD